LSCKLVRFIGGGRWATTVLIELFKTFPEIKVDWIYSWSAINKENIIVASPFLNFNNINLVSIREINSLEQADKVVICSHSSQHCKDLLMHDDNKSDILIEKPLFSEFSDFESLSELSKNKIFINLEFYNAYFISVFCNEVKQIKLGSIEINWHDPLMEERDNEATKYSEIFSSIFMDQLLHVMSILKRIKLLDIDNFSLINIDISDKVTGIIKILSTCGDITVIISLSRFAKIRERKIFVNKDDLELDFSTSPAIKKNKFKKINKPKNSLYPISQTLKNFVNQQYDKQSFLLNINSLLPEIKYCFLCEDSFISKFNVHNIVKVANKESLLKNNSMLLYYLGIIYYRQVIVGNKDNEAIHYLKGNEGVNMLLDWWLKS
jgi:hypothetical protein